MASMLRMQFFLFFLFAAFSICAEAQSRSNAIVVYDVKLREFVCWREGTLTPAAQASPCDYSRAANGWHPVTGDLYFVRGESVNLLLVNAVAQDIFSLDVKADDLAEPTVPILGTLTELPKMLPIPPAPTVVGGKGVTFAAGAPTVKPSERIYRLLSASDDKDFKNWMQSTLVDPLKAKEVTDFAAIDINTATEQLSGIDQLIDEVASLQARLNAIATPRDTQGLVNSSRSLVLLLDSEGGLRYRLTATGIITSGKTINDALTALRSAALQKALAIDSGSFQKMVSDFELAFPIELRYARINAITFKGNAFTIDSKYTEPAGDPRTDMAEFLQAVTAAATPPLSNDVVKRLKANLIALADSWDDIRISQQRREALEQAQKKVLAQRDSATGVFALQRRVNSLVDGTIQKAVSVNQAARTIALDASLCVLPIGQWFGSKTVTVSVKQGQRAALFDVGGVAESTRTSVTGGDNPAAKNTLGTAADLATVRTLQFRVFNLYHFQLGLGFLYSTAADDRFQVTTVTTGSTTQKFVDQTRSRDYNLLGTVNVLIFPSARHVFPWRPRYVATNPAVPGLNVTEKKPGPLKDIGAMFGFSITSPNKDFLLGGAWFPRPSPVGLQLAWHIGLRDYPPKGFDVTQPIAGRIVTLQQRRVNGVGVGLVFTTDFFSKVFAPIFKP